MRTNTLLSVWCGYLIYTMYMYVCVCTCWFYYTREGGRGEDVIRGDDLYTYIRGEVRHADFIGLPQSLYRTYTPATIYYRHICIYTTTHTYTRRQMRVNIYVCGLPSFGRQSLDLWSALLHSISLSISL